MNDTVKEILTVAFHERMKQVAPYVVEFDATLPYMCSYLHDMAKATGSKFKFIKDLPNGKSLFKISDPLCKILEDTGMNA